MNASSASGRQAFDAYRVLVAAAAVACAVAVLVAHLAHEDTIPWALALASLTLAHGLNGWAWGRRPARP